MLRPFLFIGVGGSGGKTLRALKQTLERRLKQYDWDQGIPGAWKFIQVDTTYDGVEFPAPMLPLEDFIGMVGPGQDYEDMVTALESRFQRREEMNSALAGWLIPASTVPILKGAGQIRTIGRAVSAAGLHQMRQGLVDAISDMSAPNHLAQLTELSELMHPKSGSKGQQTSDPAVMLISSIAGGSGAGMFMDVTETIKSISPNSSWVNNQIAFLYTPEVFNSIPTAMRAQIPMNAFGAMSEVMAGLWARQASAGTDLLFESSGVRVQRSDTNKGGIGPAGVYLIGSENSAGVNLAAGDSGAGMDEVFLAVGEAISGLVTDEKLAEEYDQRFFVNVFANSGQSADHSGLRREDDWLERMPFGGMGFARITLGMDRLMDYVAEGLAKEHVEKLLFPEFEPVNPLNPIRASQHIAEKVSASRDDFIRQSRLNEKQPHDQIVNVLRGDGLDAVPWDPAPGRAQETGILRHKAAQELAMSCVPDALRRPGVKQTPAQWLMALRSQASTLLPKFLSEQRDLTEERARLWTEEVQDFLVEYVTEWVSREGFEVTRELLAILRDDLLSLANQEMVAEAAEMRTRGQGYDAAMAGKLGSDNAQLDVNSPAVGQALQVIQTGAERLAEAELLDTVPSLIKDVVAGVIEPLMEACQIAYIQLREDVNPGGNTPAGKQFRAFADLKEDRKTKQVAPRYKPRQVERMLINSGSFPVEFEEITKRDLPDTDAQSWASLAMRMSMRGLPLRMRNPGVSEIFTQTFARVEERWVPRDSHARRDASLGAQAMEVVFPHKLGELVSRNREWLEDNSSYFGRQFRMSISDYVTGGSATTKMEREKVFLKSFEEMVALSVPLVKMNKSNIQTFHGNTNPALTPTGYNLNITDVPFSQGSSVGTSIEGILQRTNNENVSIKFDQASSAKDMFAFSTTQSSLMPMAYDSLIEPIAESWLMSAQDPQARHTFWTGRRARPLTEAIPAPPEIRASMIVGWFISYLMGEQRKDGSIPNKGTHWEIWSPLHEWISFPYPLLPSGSDLALPSILKSLSLAIVEAGKTGSREPLFAYNRLRDLGREVTTSDGIQVDRPSLNMEHRSNLIVNWVTTGQLPPRAPSDTGVFEKYPESIADPTSRRESLHAMVMKLQADYDNIWSSLENKDWRELPRVYELKDDISGAIILLNQYVSGIEIDLTSQPDA